MINDNDLSRRILSTMDRLVKINEAFTMDVIGFLDAKRLLEEFMEWRAINSARVQAHAGTGAESRRDSSV